LSRLKLIVGLGNPGREYEWTRHNLGFLAVQRLAKKLDCTFSPSSFTNGLTAQGTWEQARVCLLLPLTYMNQSGAAVGQVVARKQIEAGQILAVCDDFHLDFRTIRLRAKGSDGGHNGLKSIIERLDTQQFSRLRMGIGRPAGAASTVDYVLEEFNKGERKELDGFIEEAADCCLAWIRDGAEAAMDQYNKKT